MGLNPQSDSAFHLVYYCDSRPEIGNGHVARGVDILNAIKRRRPGLKLGAAGAFSDHARRYLDKFLDPAVQVLPGIERRARVAVLDSMWKPEEPGFVDPDRASRVRATAKKFVIISSALEVHVPVPCELLIDHVPGASVTGVKPRSVLLGLEYSPVSADFFERARRRSVSGGVLCVIGGGEDQYGPSSLAEHLYLMGEEGVTIVVSPLFPQDSLGVLKDRFPGTRFLQLVPCVATLAAAARVVICTYGNATFESLALGKPTFVTGYKSFQLEYARHLETLGLVTSVGSLDSLDPRKLALTSEEEALSRLAKEAHQISRLGSGIERIAATLGNEFEPAHLGI